MAIPLRRLLGAVTMTALISLTLAACGDDDSGDNGGNSGAQTEGQSNAPDQAALDAAVLSPDDVPAGFQQIPVEDDVEDPDNPFNDTCYGDIGKFDDRAGDPDAEAKSQFEATDTATYPSGEIKAGVSYYDDADALADTFTEFVTDIQACTTVSTTTPDGLNLNVTLTTSDFAVTGTDDGVQVTISGTISSATESAHLNGSVIALLSGHYVTNVSTFELQGSSLSAQLGDLARTQFARVTELAE